MEIFSKVDELDFGRKPFICKLPIKIINDLGKSEATDQPVQVHCSIYTFVALEGIFSARTQHTPSISWAYGGSLDWQHSHYFTVIITCRKAKSWRLMLIDGDVSKSNETYHSCPFDPSQLHLYGPNVCKSLSSNPDCDLQLDLILTPVSFLLSVCKHLIFREGPLLPLKVSCAGLKWPGVTGGSRGLDKNSKALNKRSASRAGVVLTLETWGAAKVQRLQVWGCLFRGEEHWNKPTELLPP